MLAKALDEIRKLKPPADEQATVDGWLAQVENLEGDLKEIRDKAKSNDMQRAERLVEGEPAQREEQAVGDAAGHEGL